MKVKTSELIEQHMPCKKCDANKWQLDEQSREIELKERQIQELKAQKFASFHNDECWIYQGDGEDRLESLVCPVVIAPATLLELINQRDELLLLKNIADEYGLQGIEDLAAVVRQRDDLLVALEKIAELMLCGKKDKLPGRCDKATKIAMSAISSMKGGAA